MAAGEPPRAVRRRGGRGARPALDERGLSRRRVARASSLDAARASGPWLRHGGLSSRKLERATYDSVAFRFIAANDHPDHDTIASFRRRFLPRIEALFVDVLRLAVEMGMLKMGTIGLDGTKIHANASRHSALSCEHAGKIEAQ